MVIKHSYPIISAVVITVIIFYMVSCDSGTGLTDPPPPIKPDTNIYGQGNGKLVFFRTQQIAGPVNISIASYNLTDTLVWQADPKCDSSNAVSIILPAGNYGVHIEGAVFLCNYTVTVEERKCKLLNYTNCNGGTVGCYTMVGTWLRTDDGPCVNCKGLIVQFQDGIGEVIYTPPGCRFPLSDIKWKNFNQGDCTILDLARDDYGGSPEYQAATVYFFHKDSLNINGQSGVIPYQRIQNKDVKNIKKYYDNGIIKPVDSSARLQRLR
jgi:hypothetical protein